MMEQAPKPAAKWEQIAENYKNAFEGLAKASRELGNDVSMENSSDALNKLKRELNINDLVEIKKILGFLQE